MVKIHFFSNKEKQFFLMIIVILVTGYFFQKMAFNPPQVKDSGKKSKLNINRARYEELLEVPFFTAGTASKIVEHIKKNGPITDKTGLLRIRKFNSKQLEVLERFIKFKD